MKLVSFDISNLFTNVPRDETFPFIKNLFGKNNINNSYI